MATNTIGQWHDIDQSHVMNLGQGPLWLLGYQCHVVSL